jgi:hypothetical protein
MSSRRQKWLPFFLTGAAIVGLLTVNAWAGCGSCEGAAHKHEKGEKAACTRAEASCEGAKAACDSDEACASQCALKAAAAATAVKAEGKQAKGGEGKRFYGNATCPVMGGKTNPKQFVAYKDEKTNTYAKIYLCCAGCEEKVKANPAAAYKKAYLSREVKCPEGKVLAKKGQPLDLKNERCPVMGGKVSEKVHLVYNGYKVGLCCPGCEKKFVESPEKHLTKLMPKKAPAAHTESAEHGASESHETQTEHGDHAEHPHGAE